MGGETLKILAVKDGSYHVVHVGRPVHIRKIFEKKFSV